ncbi:MAG: MGMT family protein [Armatimonadota bacterium]
MRYRSARLPYDWLSQEGNRGVFQRVYEWVRHVPAGTVVSYSEVARACGTIPILVGKAMAVSPEDVPWHRVVGADGTLKIARRGPEWAAHQRKLLEAEGVAFLPDGRVDMRYTAERQPAPNEDV